MSYALFRTGRKWAPFGIRKTVKEYGARDTRPVGPKLVARRKRLSRLPLVDFSFLFVLVLVVAPFLVLGVFLWHALLNRT